MASTGQLFNPEEFGEPDQGSTNSSAAKSEANEAGKHAKHRDQHRPEPGDVAVRVRPDVSGLDKEFDYLVPQAMTERLTIGAMVRIELNRRNVAGWVTEIGAEPPPGVVLRPITKISSVGPSGDLIDLARWAAHRWSGRVATILKTASPPRMVPSLPATASTAVPGATSTGAQAHDLPPSGIAASPVPETAPPIVVRVAPADDLTPLLVDICGRGNTLVVTPRLRQATVLAGGLRRRGLNTRVHPGDWAAAAGRGGVVIGARSAVWARIPDLQTIVVVDEHDEGLQEERNPTWNARDVAIERAARAGIDCYLISPAPSLAAVRLSDGVVQRSGREHERAGWPIVELIDRRDDEPGRGGLFSSRMAELMREGGKVLAVLNRKGRAVMLACTMCGELARTEDGEHLMIEREGHLLAPATGEERPLVCANCASTSLKRLRLGVTRAAEELSALVGEPVDELTAGTEASANNSGPRPSSRSRVVVGTEAALHQLQAADTVVFLDFDQELLAPRYRSAEQAMGLLVLAARLTGGRREGGRIAVQTRTPEHRVLRAAVRADPGLLIEAEQQLRQPMGWPPYGALAEISGASAAEFVEPLNALDNLSVLGPRDDGRYLLRAPDPEALAEVLATAQRPSGRIRVAVDPPRA